jgi:hypothetical protein
MWDEIDILLTANPNLLLNYPENKTVVKYETDYNKGINMYHSIQSLKDLDGILKNIL